MSSSSFFSYPPRGSRSKLASAKSIADHMQSHDKLRALLPTAARLTAMQKVCETVLASQFETCSVMQFDERQLTIAVPSSAIAAKLKHQLPKLQEVLLQQGWQVSAIRLKVQPGKRVEKSSVSKGLFLSNQALLAFSNLEENLESSPQNAALKEALQALVRRHQR